MAKQKRSNSIFTIAVLIPLIAILTVTLLASWSIRNEEIKQILLSAAQSSCDGKAEGAKCSLGIVYGILEMSPTGHATLPYNPNGVQIDERSISKYGVIGVCVSGNCEDPKPPKKKCDDDLKTCTSPNGNSFACCKSTDSCGSTSLNGNIAWCVPKECPPLGNPALTKRCATSDGKDAICCLATEECDVGSYAFCKTTPTSCEERGLGTKCGTGCCDTRYGVCETYSGVSKCNYNKACPDGKVQCKGKAPGYNGLYDITICCNSGNPSQCITSSTGQPACADGVYS